ncbi:MAG: FRG domain-containing protein [Phycisphaerae bacterium]|nr:FRG domain-containing protein [Phycisphaerales bacterium]
MDQLTNVTNGISTQKLESWREFYPLIEGTLSRAPAYIFRGQADSEWPINSSLDRLEKRYPKTYDTFGGIEHEFDCPPVGRDIHIKAFRQAVRHRRGPNTNELGYREWWALAQHHGLATPMLDWTLSPFVALYFAFEEDLQSDNRVVLALSTSVIGEKSSNSNPAPHPYSPMSDTSNRLVAQSGVFLEMPKGTNLEEYVREHFTDDSSDKNRHARTILLRIVIKNDDRLGCLRMLNKMNINRSTLFPDLDGAAQYINNQWELGFDTALGYVADEIE